MRRTFRRCSNAREESEVCWGAAENFKMCLLQTNEEFKNEKNDVTRLEREFNRRLRT